MKWDFEHGNGQGSNGLRKTKDSSLTTWSVYLGSDVSVYWIGSIMTGMYATVGRFVSW